MENVRFRACIWLVNTLLNYQKLTFRELDHLWREADDLSGGIELGRMKLNRIIGAAFDMLGVAIECDRRDEYRYYIAANNNVRVAEWLVSSHALNQLVTDSTNLHDRILIEEAPSGQFHLSTIVSAMKSSKALEMIYCKFVDSLPVTSYIEPYCVKLSHQRWYLLARKDHRPHLQIFALDRIRQLRILQDSHFAPPADFNAHDYFAFYFGVHTGSDSAPSPIRLRTDVFWRNYLRTLPLHHSQREIQTSADGSVFEYVMAVTPDLVNQLLSYGSSIEVLEPLSLRQQLRESIRQMSILYNV